MKSNNPISHRSQATQGITMPNELTAVEIFLAKGGKINVIKEGVRSATDRELYLGVRGLSPKRESAESIISNQYGDSLTDTQHLQAVENLKINRG